jgi:hypothetical protein
MTIRRDYLLRLIDEFFKFLAKILQLRTEKQYQKALDLIDEASATLLHTDLSEFMEDDEVIRNLIESKSFNLDQIEILAELLKIKADINLDLYNNITAIRLYEKSILLFNHVQSSSKNFSLERIKKMDEINYTLINLKG